MCSAVWSLFKAPYHFRRTWSLTVPACDTVQTEFQRHELVHIRSFPDSDWNEPTQRTGRAVPAVAWLGGRKELPAASPDLLAMIAIRSPQLAYHARTLTGKLFLAEVLVE